MKSVKILFTALVLFIVLISYVIWNIGLLKTVTVEQVETPEMFLVFKKFQGPYHEVGAIFAQVEKVLANDNIPCEQTFGRYYDNPNEVEAERTRADVGCIVTTGSLPTLEEFQAEQVPPFKALSGTFDGAPWLTAFKVYKAIRKESYKRNILLEDKPVYEIYEKTEMGFKTKVLFKVKD